MEGPDRGIRPAFPVWPVTLILVVALVGVQLAAGARSRVGWGDERVATGASCALEGAGPVGAGRGGTMANGRPAIAGQRGTSGNLQVATFALG